MVLMGVGSKLEGLGSLVDQNCMQGVGGVGFKMATSFVTTFPMLATSSCLFPLHGFNAPIPLENTYLGSQVRA